jgi:hypothetical protein
MKVKYEGGSAAVTVDRVGRVERGSTIEVDDQVGKQLVEQGWKKVGSSTSKKGGKKASKKGGRKKASSTPTSTTTDSSADASSPPAPPVDDNPAG